jgi:hypothetical protein
LACDNHPTSSLGTQVVLQLPWLLTAPPSDSTKSFLVLQPQPYTRLTVGQLSEKIKAHLSEIFHNLVGFGRLPILWAGGHARISMILVNRVEPEVAAGQPVPKNIAPDAAGAIGPVAGLEARLHRGDEVSVPDLEGVSWAVEPGREARVNISSSSNCHLKGQTWRYSVTKANLISARMRTKLPFSYACGASTSPSDLFLQYCNLCQIAHDFPVTQKSHGRLRGSGIPSHRKGSPTTWPQAACLTTTLQPVRSLMASLLTSKLNFPVVVSALKSPEDGAIVGSDKTSLAQFARTSISTI